METEQRVVTAFFETHPEEAALILEGFPHLEAARVLQDAPPESAATVLKRMAPNPGAKCLASMEGAASRAITSRLTLDTAALLLRLMEAPARNSLIAGLPPGIVESLRLLLSYPDGTAGSLMDPRAFSLPDDIRISEALARVRNSPEHVLYYLYLVDRDHRLSGVLNLRELMLAAPESLVSSVMQRQVSRIVSGADREAIVSHPGWRRFHALPVVDEAGLLLGAIRYETLRWLEEAAIKGQKLQGPLGALLTVGELYWVGLSRLTADLLSAVVAAPARKTADPGEQT